MDHFTNRGITLQYEVQGQGIPLVFLHGMGGSIRQIHGAYDPIEGVQLITLNQQGHGDTDADWDHYNFQALAEDVRSLLDHLGVGKVFLAGISMGAAVSLKFSLLYPDRVSSLLLIRNAWTDLPMSPEVQAAYRDLGLALKEGSQEAFRKSESFPLISRSSPYTQHAFEVPFHDESCLKYWQKYLILPPQTPVSSLDECSALTMPVRILACRNDLCHPFQYGQRLTSAIPGSIFTEIPDKDSNPQGHKRMTGEAIRKMISESL